MYYIFRENKELNRVFNRVPYLVYNDFRAACEVAESMAKRNPKTSYYVLALIAPPERLGMSEIQIAHLFFSRVPVAISDPEEKAEDDIPF